MRWLLALLAASAVALVSVMAAGFGKDPHAVPFKLRGKPAPDFELTELGSGRKVHLSELKGKPVVLNFWASWCGPCEAEDPVLAWGAQRFGNDVQFLGVVFEDTEENANRFLAQHGRHFPQLFDPRSRVSVDYGASGVPETYFIDSRGIIVDKHLGGIDPDSLVENLRRVVPGLPALGSVR
jgi:cytochrome c biogenesis protein CcmG/thiol:disulfide interchange protein DsbE